VIVKHISVIVGVNCEVLVIKLGRLMVATQWNVVLLVVMWTLRSCVAVGSSVGKNLW